MNDDPLPIGNLHDVIRDSAYAITRATQEAVARESTENRAKFEARIEAGASAVLIVTNDGVNLTVELAVLPRVPDGGFFENAIMRLNAPIEVAMADPSQVHIVPPNPFSPT